MIEECFKYISKEELFSRTGVAFEQFNTIYQLLGMKKMNDPALSNANTLLLMPDLINYMLTGEKVSEYTEATTTQLYNHEKGSWDEHILDKIGVPSHIFTKIVKPGTVIGGLRDSIIKESGLKNCKVISVGSHDTASAMAAAASMGEGSVSIATGTWALLGVPMDSPVTNEKAIKYNFTNEGGAASKVLMLKNIMGLWLLQECRRAWIKGGRDIGFGEMVPNADEPDIYYSGLSVVGEGISIADDVKIGRNCVIQKSINDAALIESGCSVRMEDEQ
jgi:sugar (pentulose or hexulose) kinase